MVTKSSRYWESAVYYFKLCSTWIVIYRENQVELKAELDAVFVDLDNIFKEDDGLSANFQKHADKIAEMRHQMTVIENVLQSAHVSKINLGSEILVLSEDIRRTVLFKVF